jgi:putative ABC transport system permease protein
MTDAQGTIPLDAFDLAIAGMLVLVAGLVSVGMRLGLHKTIAIATVRTVVQLILLGFILRWLFEINDPVVLCLVIAVMMTAAGLAAVGRSERGFSGVHSRAILTLFATGTLTTFTVTGAVVGVEPWHDPQYVIPLMGMVLGNSLTGISLCLDSLLERLSERADEVELALSFGATSREAIAEPLQYATRRGMIPIINAMMVVGIVSLPGMMTGQILAGADPMEAVKYQLVVMFMLVASNAMGCVLMGMFVFKRLFNDKHQLRRELVTKRAR